MAEDSPLEDVCARIGADIQLARFWITKLGPVFSASAPDGRLTQRDCGILEGVQLLLRSDNRTLMELEALASCEGAEPFLTRSAQPRPQRPEAARAGAVLDPLDIDMDLIDAGPAPSSPQDHKKKLRATLDSLVALRARLAQANETL
ncbi:MAG: hypothetical protein AAF661_01635 [Pseudomonadota bacterium]